MASPNNTRTLWPGRGKVVSTRRDTGSCGITDSMPMWKKGTTIGRLGAWATSLPTPHFRDPSSRSLPFSLPPRVSRCLGCGNRQETSMRMSTSISGTNTPPTMLSSTKLHLPAAALREYMAPLTSGAHPCEVLQVLLIHARATHDRQSFPRAEESRYQWTRLQDNEVRRDRHKWWTT